MGGRRTIQNNCEKRRGRSAGHVKVGSASLFSIPTHTQTNNKVFFPPYISTIQTHQSYEESEREEEEEVGGWEGDTHTHW